MGYNCIFGGVEYEHFTENMVHPGRLSSKKGECKRLNYLGKAGKMIPEKTVTTKYGVQRWGHRSFIGTYRKSATNVFRRFDKYTKSGAISLQLSASRPVEDPEQARLTRQGLRL
jgi:hypothetical protein